MALSGVGTAVGLASLTSFTAASLSYPIYLLLLGLTLPGTIIVSRKRKDIALFR